MASHSAQASTFVFNPGGGTDDKFSTKENWQGGVAPVSGPSISIEIPASYDATMLSGPSVDFDSSALRLGKMTVTSVVAGGELNLTSTAVAPRLVTVDSVSVAKGATLKADSTLTWTGRRRGLVFNSAGQQGSIVLSGGVEGASGISVQGGEVTLQNANTYGGETIIDQGKLIVGPSGDLGTGSAVTVKNGAALVLNATSPVAVSGLRMEGGEVSGSDGLSLPTGAAIRVNTTTGVTAKISALISETGAGPGVSFTKDGAGRLILSHSNAYSGDTTINSGIVEVAESGVFGSGAIIIKGGVLTANSSDQTVTNAVQVKAPVQLGEAGAGVLDLQGPVSVAGHSITVIDQVTISGVVTGKLEIAGPGNLTLSNPGNAIDTVLNGGVLTVGDAVALGNNAATANGTLALNAGVLDVYGAEAHLRGLTVTGGAIVDTDVNGKIVLGGNTTVTMTANIPAGAAASVGVPIYQDPDTTASVLKKGEGRLILSAASSFTGGTTIEKGTIVLGANSDFLGNGPLGASSSKVYLTGGNLDADGGPRSIENALVAKSGKSAVGSAGSVINVGALEFERGASLTIHGKLTSAAPVDLAGGNLVFGSGKTAGKTTLEIPGLSATNESVVSFNKDSSIVGTGPLDFTKVRLAMSAEALAAVARTLPRAGLGTPQTLATVPGGNAGDVILPANVSAVAGSSAAIKVAVLPSTGPDPGVIFQPERKSYASLANGGNARNFAKSLDRELNNQLGSGSTIAQLIDKLDALTSTGEVGQLLRVANGGPTYASIYGVAMRRIQGVGSQLDSHLDALAASSNSEYVHSFGVSQAGNHPTMMIPTGGAHKQGQWAAWASGYASQSHRDKSSSVSGDTNSHDQGAAIGAERAFGNLRLGATAQSGQADASFVSSGRLDSDHWSAGGFASVAIGNIVLDASAMYGNADNQMKRYNGIGTVKGDFSSHDTQVGIGAALNLAPANSPWQVTPVARLKHLSYSQAAFSERGPGFLDVDSMSEGGWITKLGMRFARLAETGKAVAFSLDGGAYWMHDFDAQGKPVNLRVSGSNSAFSATGSGTDADSIQLNLGAQVTFSDAYSVRLGGQQEFGKNRRQSTGILSVGLTF